MDHQALPALDMHLACDPDIGLHLIADDLGVRSGKLPEVAATAPALGIPAEDAALDMSTLAGALGEGLRGECVSLVRLPLGGGANPWHFRHPLDYLGTDGGGGIGSGPGTLIGAAPALEGTGRLAVGVLGEGDFLLAASALCTGAHYRGLM